MPDPGVVWVEIPKGDYATSGPCWIPDEGGKEKPWIKCQCGKITGIGLHHVHADGTVTASYAHWGAEHFEKIDGRYFFTHNGKRYSGSPGCGWHVMLKLKDYDCGDFPSRP